MNRSLRAVALLLVLSTCAAAIPAISPVTSALKDPTPVLIVQGASARDAAPAEAVDELAGLLAVGGLTQVRRVEAATGAALLDAVRRADATHLVVVAHGSPAGLAVGDDVVPWAALHAALEVSRAEFVYVGACDSSLLGEVAGKTVLTTFEGEVDQRVVAPQIASDMFAAAFPLLDISFEQKLLAHVEERGGLEHYAQLIVFPELTLATPDPDACTQDLEKFYQGQSVQSTEGCIYYSAPGTTNCNSVSQKDSAPCVDFASQDQEEWNRESAPSAEPVYAPDDGSSAAAASSSDAPATAAASNSPWWLKLAAKAGVTVVDDENPNNPTGIYVRYGPTDGLDSCVTIVRAEDIFSAGTTPLIRAAIKNIKASLPSNGKGSVVPESEASVALRLCGTISLNMPRVDANKDYTGKGAGILDARASGRASVSWEVKVFRWTLTLTAGIEGGIKYPFSVGVGFAGRMCSSQWALSNLRYRVETPVEAGGLILFVYGLAGYKEVGWSHDFGLKWSHTWAWTRDCASSSSATEASASPLPRELGPTLQRLVDAGLAKVNPEPTIVMVDEQGAAATVKASYLVVTPGSGEFNHYARIGALDALGIDPALPATHLLLLDITNARVTRALGLTEIDTITPEVSLVDGVAIVPSTTVTSDAMQTFCETPYGPEALLHLHKCAGLDFSPSLAASSTTACVLPESLDPPAMAFQEPGNPDPTSVGAATTTPMPCAGDVSDVTSLAQQPYHDAYRASCGSDAPSAVQPYCSWLRRRQAADGAFTQLDLMGRIHEAQEIVSRPTQAHWLLTPCDANAAGLRPGDEVRELSRLIGNAGQDALTHGCLQLDNPWLLPNTLDYETVTSEFLHGFRLIESYSLKAHEMAMDATSGDPPTGVPDVGPLVDEIYCGADPGVIC